MSAHVEQRLSAYLDAELTPDERAGVEAHLGECAACRAVLEELRAVDDLARAAELAAPEGYFDALPGRVRARVAARPRRWRPPLWGLAAAAAVLLAVVTPITLRELPELEELVSQPARAPAAAPEPAAPALADDADDAPEDDALREEALEALPGQAVPAPAPAPLGTPRAAEGFAAPPRTAAPPPGRQPEPETRAAREQEFAKQRRAQPSERIAPSAAPAGGGADVGRARAAEGTDLAAVEADAAPTAAEARAERERLRQRLAKTEDVSAPEEKALARDAGVQDDDGLRVRIIELSLRAWLLEANPDDREQLVRDAEAYLARRAAARPDYVRELLARAAAR